MECRRHRSTTLGMCGWVVGVWAALWAGAARAQTPLELAVVVNAASPRSLAVANEYIALRGIPATQVFYLDLPAKVLSARAEVTAAEFEDWIWQPLAEQVQARGLAAQVAAWVFSADFPRRVAGEHGVLSLPGAMFFWDDRPTAEAVKEGRALSPYFQGPGMDQTQMGSGASLGRFAESLGDQRPRPSALLAWTGARGMTLPGALALLHRAREADHTWPTGTVFFALSEDVRSRCRAWQYPQAVRELQSLSVAVE